MRIEQALTLLDLPDSHFVVEDRLIYKKGREISIMDASNHYAFAVKTSNNLKMAEKIDEVKVYMPSAISAVYSDKMLEKIADSSGSGTLQERLQRSILKLSSSKKPVPSVDSIIRLSSFITKGVTPDILTLRFAQWGGMGNMVGNQQSGMGGSPGSSSGNVNMMDRWQSQLTMDTALDQVRGPKEQWYSSTEGKLSQAGFYNHAYADENAKQYDLSWGDRIKNKNLRRLQQLFKNNREREEREKNYTPQRVRFDQAENENPRHYSTVETFLDEKRETPDNALNNHRRIEEPRPEWYEELATLRRYSESKKKIVEARVPEDVWQEGKPSRRTHDDEDVGRFGIDLENQRIKSPAGAAGAQITRDYTASQILGNSWPYTTDEPSEGVENTDQSITQYNTGQTKIEHTTPEGEQDYNGPGVDELGVATRPKDGLEGRLNQTDRNPNLQASGVISPELDDHSRWNDHPQHYTKW